MEAGRAKEREAERQRNLLRRLRLYHFTDARNVPSIREQGGVFSAEQCEQLGIKVVAPGGDENSQGSDREKYS